MGKNFNYINAKIQINFNQKFYSDDIRNSSENSKFYTNPNFNLKNRFDNPAKLRFIDMCTSESVYKIYNEYGGGYKIGVLNFASFKYPGGGFLKGYMAQEEDLCHSSTLYNVLASDGVFKWYKHSEYDDPINNHLFQDSGIYSPCIVFNNEDRRPEFGLSSKIQDYDLSEDVCADVITVAAPYCKKAIRSGVSINEIRKAIQSRVDTVFQIAMDNNVDILILGAFGCGVFGCDPTDVASAFNDSINKYSKEFKEIVFAIPKKSNSYNFTVFKNILEKD